MKHRRLLIGMFSLLLAFGAQAKVEVLSFESPEHEERYNKLIAELRCLVCQNQNIAESNAELAKDMRRKTHEMVTQGKTEKEISSFMVERYGDFVLYRPPFEPMTWLLWLGPAIIFLFALVFVIRFVKSLNDGAQTEELSEEDIERIKNLHAEQDKQ